MLVGFGAEVWATANDASNPHEKLDENPNRVRFTVRLDCPNEVSGQTVKRITVEDRPRRIHCT